MGSKQRRAKRDVTKSEARCTRMVFESFTFSIYFNFSIQFFYLLLKLQILYASYVSNQILISLGIIVLFVNNRESSMLEAICFFITDVCVIEFLNI